MKKYLRMAREAHRKGCTGGIISCIMTAAIDAEEYDDAHDVATCFPDAIGDDLVQRLQAATLDALAKARAATKKK